MIPGSDDTANARQTMIADNYTKPAIATLEQELNKIDSKLLNSEETPLSSGYILELDSLKELTPRQVHLNQSGISTLQWIYELGRVDILIPVCLIWSYLVSPRIGHLNQDIYCFLYLKAITCSKVVFDDIYPYFDYSSFFKHIGWEEFYPKAIREQSQSMHQVHVVNQLQHHDVQMHIILDVR